MGKTEFIIFFKKYKNKLCTWLLLSRINFKNSILKYFFLQFTILKLNSAWKILVLKSSLATHARLISRSHAQPTGVTRQNRNSTAPSPVTWDKLRHNNNSTRQAPLVLHLRLYRLGLHARAVAARNYSNFAATTTTTTTTPWNYSFSQRVTYFKRRDLVLIAI